MTQIIQIMNIQIQVMIFWGKILCILVTISVFTDEGML